MSTHGGYPPLCEDDHTCPPCEDHTGPCADLFEHPMCGVVACCAKEDA